MTDASTPNLTVTDVQSIINNAKSSASDPITTALQIFTNLGDQATISGDVLRQALVATAPLPPQYASLLVGLQSIAKSGSTVTLTSTDDTQATISGTQARLKKIASFDVGSVNGQPAITNIAGLSVHKFFWIDIQSVQLLQSQGQRSIRVVTSAATKDFPLP
ncbi:MAG TPA: hypothetical protein VGI16_04740 [Candidatus Acidoferrum sp.]|jgi:hypothetical protein